MVQVPVAISVTVAPDTLHTEVVSDVKLTVNPELAVALNLNGCEPSVLFGSDPKAMVWLALVTWKPCVTGAAAL
jgi:hypothetical protein